MLKENSLKAVVLGLVLATGNVACGSDLVDAIGEKGDKSPVAAFSAANPVANGVAEETNLTVEALAGLSMSSPVVAANTAAEAHVTDLADLGAVAPAAAPAPLSAEELAAAEEARLKALADAQLAVAATLAASAASPVAEEVASEGESEGAPALVPAATDSGDDSDDEDGDEGVPAVAQTGEGDAGDDVLAPAPAATDDAADTSAAVVENDDE